MIALIITVGNERFTRGAAVGQSFTEMMDSFTSERTELWRNALSNPPRNPFFGVGIGNGSREQATLSVTVIRKHETKIVRLKHLHNFLLDAWYETGLFGLGALLFWLVEVLRRGLVAWREHKPPYSAHAGVFLAAALGIMSNAMFSYSYTSKQFAGYLFVFFAALVHLRALVASKVAT